MNKTQAGHTITALIILMPWNVCRFPKLDIQVPNFRFEILLLEPFRGFGENIVQKKKKKFDLIYDVIIYSVHWINGK